jgi:RNA-directed DNA polymerase
VLLEAYRLAKKNNGAPGIDGVTFADIEEYGSRRYLSEIREELLAGDYKPLPCRRAEIPKNQGTRILKIPAIRDRVVEGALKLILEPIFEPDFQEGSFGYRPNHNPHQALARVQQGLYHRLHQVINLDIKAYFDNVRHHLLLDKIAERISDKEVLRLCRLALKSSGKKGLCQGSVIGPLFANLYLNDVDKMLEKAQNVTRQGRFETVLYTRFADDLVVLVSNHPSSRHWAQAVEKRIREEFEKLELTVNKEKSTVTDFSMGNTLDYLGYSFRWCQGRKNPSKKVVIARPQVKKRTEFLRRVKKKMKGLLHVPIAKVIHNVINPMVRGWVNYFRWENASYDLRFVAWRIEGMIRRFASRQQPKRKGGKTWTGWSREEIYGNWGLFSDYRVSWAAQP